MHVDFGNDEIRVEWRDVGRFIDLFEAWVDGSNYMFDGVYGMPRGGLVPAVMASHRLDIPLLDSPTLHSIIIDDIVDTGKTLWQYHDEGFKVASMFNTAWSSFQPDFHAFEKRSGWVVFPWEA